MYEIGDIMELLIYVVIGFILLLALSKFFTVKPEDEKYKSLGLTVCVVIYIVWILVKMGIVHT